MKPREKLIELILNFYDGDSICDTCENDKSYGRCNKCLSTHEADHLIANGVVVLPCRCGECAYCEDGIVPWCNHLQIGVSKDAYCSGGKRKDDIVDLCTTGYLHLGYVEEKGGDK